MSESDALAIDEFREKFIKSGAIKFASLREAFRKIDTNKNGKTVLQYVSSSAIYDFCFASLMNACLRILRCAREILVLHGMEAGQLTPRCRAA
jgi:hypothetical protein